MKLTSDCVIDIAIANSSLFAISVVSIVLWYRIDSTFLGFQNVEKSVEFPTIECHGNNIRPNVLPPVVEDI